MVNYKSNKFWLIFLSFLTISSIGIATSPYTFNDILGVSIVSPLESNGAIPVNIQDQTSRAFDVYFVQPDETTQTTLLDNGNIDSYDINITNTTGYVIGDFIGIFEESQFYYGTILDINGNTLTMDTPLDYNITTSALVLVTDREMNVDGSGTRQIFGIQLPSTSTINIDITRVLFQMTCEDPPNFDGFCDIPDGLVNGIVLRRVDGTIQNYWNVKQNSDFVALMYDVAFYEATRNPNVNGVGGRMTFAGPSKHGVTIRLEAGDSLQLIVQDNLESITSFRVIGEGHLVTD